MHFTLLQKFGRGTAYNDLLLLFVFPAVKFIDILLRPYIGVLSTGFRPDLIKISELFNGDGSRPAFFTDCFLNIERG